MIRRCEIVVGHVWTTLLYTLIPCVESVSIEMAVVESEVRGKIVIVEGAVSATDVES